MFPDGGAVVAVSGSRPSGSPDESPSDQRPTPTVTLYRETTNGQWMRSFELELPAETAESVEVEADLLGFDSPASYVRWVVSRRFAIDDGSEPSAKLEEYAARVRELDESGDRESLMEAARHAEDAGGTASEATGATTDAGDDADGATPTPGPEPGGSAVDRIEDDEIDDAVSALSSVEQGRVDEFARRALSRTRERLDGDVETGIDYSARNALDDGAPPGSEITDLSALGVPGRDEKLMERRRRAVGAALAYLKDVETAKRGDFVAELYEEHPAGYESVDGWWGCIKRGLRQVDRVKPASENSRVWGFRTTPGRVTRISYQ